MTRDITKLLGRWRRRVLFPNEESAECVGYSECTSCGARVLIHSADEEKEMRAHESQHPQMGFFQDAWRFQSALHMLAIEKVNYFYGIEALMWPDKTRDERL